MCFYIQFWRKFLFWNIWKQNHHSSDLHHRSLLSVRLSVRDLFTCTWNVRTTEYFLRRSLTFCVESVEQYFSLICIAITMEWRRVQTSKILFYLRTVTCRDAPIQIKYNNRTKFPLLGSHMAKLNWHTEEFPVTNMSYISIILSSDNKVMVEL